MNSVFSWKGTIQSVFMVLPSPGVARQGFVTSTIWQEICSRKDRPIFLLVCRRVCRNFPRPCSSTLGQVERFSWTDPLSLFHLFHVDLKTPLFLFHLFHVDLETCFYLFHLFHLCQLVPTCAIWLHHLNLCQLFFLRFFLGFLNVIPSLEKSFD